MMHQERADRVQGLSPAKRRLLLEMLARQADSTAAERAIPRRSGEGAAPLSFSQLRMWILQRMMPGSPAYNLTFVVRLAGALDRRALAMALAEVVRRHDVLRTRFVEEGAQPVQVPTPAGPLDLPLVDVEACGRSRAEVIGKNLAQAQAAQPFDLATDMPFRILLVRVSRSEHLVLFCIHHIVFDGWSIGILAREVGALYGAFAACIASPLPELSLQYADYAAWQRSHFQREKQLAFWRQELGGAPALLELPTDHPRATIRSSAGRSWPFAFAPDLAMQAGQTADRERASLFMVLLAAFQVLMARYSGQEDICVGSPVANRERPEIEDSIGCFTNTLVLRTRLSGRPTGRELLAEVRAMVLRALAHRETPFEVLVDELQPERDLSRTPLFQVMFALQNNPEPVLSLSGLAIELQPIASTTARFDLTLDLFQATGGLHGAFEYSRSLFDRPTIGRLERHFHLLLDGLTSDLAQRVWDLPLLCRSERQQLITEWTDTETLCCSEGTIQQAFAAQVARTPGAFALIAENGEELTYGELDCRATRLAARLRAGGMGAGLVVGLCLERSTTMVVALLATLKCGAAYLPLDPAYPGERLAFVMKDAGARLLLTERSLALLAVDGIAVLYLDDLPPERESAVTLWDEVPAGSLAYVIYTSGSTGRPKGVMASHANVCNFFAAMDARIGAEPSGVWLAVTSVAFDISVLELLWTLVRGFTVVLLRDTGRLLTDPAAAIEDGGVEGASAPWMRCRVTHLQCTPSLARVLHLSRPAMTAMGSLRHLLLGGEALPLDLGSRLRAELPAEIHNMYGPTETTVWSASHRLAGEAGSSIPIGRPLANNQIYVLDRSLLPVPLGVVGELYIAGDGVTRGYLNRPDVTAASFIPHPFVHRPGARLYRTGDLARFRADGALEFLGRRDQQVKLHGFRIELGEIEAALDAHPAVEQSAVAVRETAPHSAALVAYITGAGATALPETELRQFLREKLPEYMVPSAFVHLDRLPLTPNGKIDRRALPAPRPARALAQSPPAMPRTPAEAALAAVWARLFGVTRVGIDDNFFELGGDSLLVLQMVARANEEGLRVTPSLLFQQQTIRALAAALERLGIAPAAEPLTAMPRQGSEPQRRGNPPAGLDRAFEDSYALSPLQRGLLFHALEASAPEMYVFQLRCILGGDLDRAAFELGWHSIIARHPALRTEFHWQGLASPMQYVRREVRLEIDWQDWRDLPPDEQRERLAGYVADDRGTGFTLTRAPLMRLAVIQLAPRRYQMVWTYHHLLLDGWSTHLVLQEALSCYEAGRRGVEPALPPPVPFGAFIDWVEGQSTSAAESFWRDRLSGFKAPTPLARSLPAGTGVSEARWGRCSRSLSPARTEALRAGARHLRLTLNTLAQGAWALLQSHYSGQRDIVFGAVSSGRPADLPGMETIVGNLASTLPLRVVVPERGPVLDWLLELQAQQFEARRYEHRALADIQAWSEVPRPLPLFETILGFQSMPARDPHSLRIASLRIGEVQDMLLVGYPMVIIVLPGAELKTEIEYECARFHRRDVESLLQSFDRLLDAFAAGGQADLAALRAMLKEADEREARQRVQVVTKAVQKSVRDVRRRSR